MTSNSESDCSIKDTINYKNHWDKAYIKSPTEKLGWYEEKSTPTLELITKTQLSKDATILNVGSGSSTLIDDLLAKGYTNIIANDISSEALISLEERLGVDKDKVQYIEDDLIQPTELQKLKVDLWNDRAVLHFFTEELQRKAYFDLLKKTVKVDGFVIIATFAIDGAKKCCGLNIHQYNTEMLVSYLGESFELVESFHYTFTNPNKDPRPYIYTLFKRTID